MAPFRTYRGGRVSADPQKQERERFGVVPRLLIVVLAFIGAWVVLGHAYDWARPWWRYASIASISFTVGAMYGRFRRWEHDDKARTRKPRA
jgi:hypothetical protein